MTLVTRNVEIECIALLEACNLNCILLGMLTTSVEHLIVPSPKAAQCGSCL